MDGKDMRVLCVDIDKELWRDMKADAAIRGTTLKDYIADALEFTLAEPKFRPTYRQEGNSVARKSVQMSEDLWEKLSIAAVKSNVSKRDYLSSAITEFLKEGRERSKIQAAFEKFHQKFEAQMWEIVPYKERLLDGDDPGRIMSDMEAKFKIPALNDPEFNRQYPEVIKLYRTIAGWKEMKKSDKDKELER
jgi:hypothetical protein